MNTHLLSRLFTQVANPPTLRQDDESIILELTPFSIMSNSIKMANSHTIHIYTLSASCPDGDYVDIFESVDLREVFVKTVSEYVEWRCRNILDDMSVDAMYADWVADRKAVEDAYKEGKAYYNSTKDGEREPDRACPYPEGIEHHEKWWSGYHQAQNENVF